MIKIAFSGVHGTGKTSLIKTVSQLLIKYNKSVYVVREVARECPYPINEESTVRSQRWLWSEHQKSELEAVGSGCEIILCDRSLMDNLCYYKRLLKYQGLNDDIFDTLVKMTALWMKTYNEVLFFPINEKLLVADDKRSDSKEFAMVIDEMMRDMIMPYANLVIRDVREFNAPEYVKSIIKRV